MRLRNIVKQYNVAQAQTPSTMSLQKMMSSFRDEGARRKVDAFVESSLALALSALCEALDGHPQIVVTKNQQTLTVTACDAFVGRLSCKVVGLSVIIMLEYSIEEMSTATVMFPPVAKQDRPLELDMTSSWNRRWEELVQMFCQQFMQIAHMHLVCAPGQ